MKRILFSSLLLLSACAVFAQPSRKANDLIKQNKTQEAKTEIDKVLANEKNAKDAEAWYVKSKVYSQIANDEQLSASVPDAREISFEAVKKYTELADKNLLSMTLENFKPIMDVYQGYFKTGATYYNNNNFADAYNNFKKCLEVSQYMVSKGWSSLKVDTSVILYTGISAEKSNKKDEAAIYYSMLADAKVTGEGMQEIYKWLADYYNQKKDTENAQKYVTLGKELFPKDAFWGGFELELAREKGDKNAIYSKYEEIIKNDPTNHLYIYNYGVELYKDAYNEDTAKRPANSAEMINKAMEHFKKTIELKPDYASANLVMGQILYNQGVDINAQAKAIKAPAGGKLKPEDQKKKDEAKAAMLKKFDEAIPYFEKVDQLLGGQGKLKMEERQNLKDAYDLMITIYDQKGQKEKMKFYEEKFNNVDKVH
jgi:tetratricopeptide (TPR) repeat protein